MPSITLTYFNSPGRAEPIRIALRLAGVPFEDRRVDFAGFGALKASGALPLGSVPVLEVDGLVMTQTGAMLRYAAALGGGALYPKDPMEAFIVDSVVDTLNDTLSHAMLPSLFERDMEKKLAMRAELAAGPMARTLSYVDGLVGRSSGPFLLGDRLSIADLVIAAHVNQIESGRLDGITPEYLDRWPRLRALAAAYRADPRVSAVS